MSQCTEMNKDHHREAELKELRQLEFLDSLPSTKNPLNLKKRRRPNSTFLVDTTHSSIQFSVSHWGIYNIIGWIESYEIIAFYDRPDFSDMVIEAKIRPSSIQMPNKEMANNLKNKGSGFFDVEDHPIVYFSSDTLIHIEENKYKIPGRLRIKEVEMDIIFDLIFNGFTHPPTKSMPGFTVYGVIKRDQFKIGGTDVLPGNGLPIIGNDVHVTINARLIHEYD